MEVLLNSIEETVKFGERIGRLVRPGDVIALVGQLGSGKTTLVKGLAAGMGVKDPRHVTSPSFVILKEYRGRIPLYHFDVYRLDGPSGMETVGYQDFFYGKGASVIEWADKIRDLLPEEYMTVELEVSGESSRRARISAWGERYEELRRRIG